MIDQFVFEKDIEECEKSFYAGNRVMLFEAIRRCAQYKIPMPRWVRDEFEAGLSAYYKAEVYELGEAFGIVRDKGFHCHAENKRLTKALKVWKRIKELNKAGESIGPDLFNKVGKEFAIGESLARDYYRIINKEQKKD